MKQVYHIESEKSIESSQQLLSIRIGERHFGFSTTSGDAGELFNLTWYTGTEIDEAALKEFHDKHPELAARLPSYFHLL